MKAKFTFYVVVLMACFSSALGQSGMPYLNASAGNTNATLRGPDSSMYYLDGSKLLKMDKNKAIQWSKDYNGVIFSALLLSKTGSLFFLAGEKVGKLNAATGNMVWVKSYPGYAYTLGGTQYQSSPAFTQLLLDRNNHLAISGINAPIGNTDAVFLKLDTNGTVVDQKLLFNSLPSGAFLQNFNIIQDSVGYYSFLVTYYEFPGSNAYLLTYNSATNRLKDTMKFVANLMSNFTLSRFIKSGRNATDFYLGTSKQSSGIIFDEMRLAKYNSTRQRGNYTVINWAQSYFDNVGEDEKGNMSLVFHNGSANGVTPIVVNLDSNFTRLSAFQYTAGTAQANPVWTKVWPFYDQSVFIQEHSNTLPANTIRLFDGKTPPSCITNFSLGTTQLCNSAPCRYSTVEFANVFSFMTYTVPVTTTFSTQPVSYTVSSFTPVLDLNYCSSSLSVMEQAEGEDTFRMMVFPQPTHGSVVLTTNKQTESEVIILNGLGSVVKKYHLSGQSLQMDLSDLPAGLYYAERRGGDGTNVAKIIKTN